MRRIHVLGSSHACRILEAVTQNVELTKTFSISGTVKPGAKLADLKFPSQYLASFKESDILLIQLFGNELIKRNIIVERKNGKKIIHLTAFEPEPAWKIQRACTRLKELLEPLQCRIFIIDNPLRHIRCCRKHRKNLKGLHSYLEKQNRLLARFFQGFSTVLNHKKYLGMSRRKTGNLKVYLKLFSDSVHFKRNVYSSLAQRIAEMHLLIN